MFFVPQIRGNFFVPKAAPRKIFFGFRVFRDYKVISPVGGNPFFGNSVTVFGYRFAKKSFLLFVFLFFCMIFGNTVTKRITNERKASVIFRNIG